MRKNLNDSNNSCTNWYFYLCYKIYEHYLRKGDSIPVFYSFLASTTLIGFNILTLFSIIDVWLPFTDSLYRTHKYAVHSVLIVVAIFNYLFLYRQERYVEVFQKMEEKNVSIKYGGRYVLGYILFTVITLVITAVISKYRNLGHL